MKKKFNFPKISGAMIFFVILVIVIIAMSSLIKSKGDSLKQAQVHKQKPDVNVVVLKLAPSVVQDKINLPGIVVPWIDLTVVSEVTGKVIKKNLEDGALVSVGDVICEIDPVDYQNNLDAQKASLKAGLASLKRLKKLSRDNLSTRSELDEAVAKVENLKAAVKTAELNLKRCTITAPVSGIVNKVNVETGTYMSIGSPAARILQMDRVKVKVGIPESDVADVAKVQRCNIKIDALDKIFKGTKYFLSKAADSAARVYNLFLELANPDLQILPDMFARVEILKKESRNCIAIPAYSIVPKDDENIVYIANKGKALLRKVRLGLQEGKMIEIESGLSFSEDLIIEGQRNVKNGDNVKIVRTIADPKDISK